MQVAPNATALNGGSQDGQHLQRARRVPAGPGGRRGAESVQNELMTTREWQHNFYGRDRWQVNDKLTLDLGLRYEYYPLMQRADRGIEQVVGANDLNSTRSLTRACTVTRCGGARRSDAEGSRHQGEQAPCSRRGSVPSTASTTTPCSGPATAITYNPLPFSRPLRGFFPLTLGVAVQRRPSRSGGRPRSSRAFRTSSVRTLSSGRLPLPNSYLMRTPAERRVARPHPVVERRRSSAGCRGTSRSTSPTSARRRMAASPTSTPTRPTCPAAARPAGRCSNDSDGNNSLLLWGPIAKSRYHSLQVAINRPFKNGLMLKGAYTLSKAKNEVDDDGWSQLTWNAPSQRSRNYALAGYDRTHMFQMAFVYELPYKTATAKDIGAPDPRRLADQRHLQRHVGHAVHDHGERRDARTCRAACRRQT